MSNTANQEQLDYLRTLFAERSDEPFPYDQWKEKTTVEASAMIDELKRRPALPPTEAQLEEIAQLREELDFEDRGPIENRRHANAVIRTFRKVQRARAYYARKADAAAELDALLQPPF